MNETTLLESVIVKTKANELILLNANGTAETLIAENNGIKQDWLHLFAVAPALFGQLKCCNDFLEALKPLCVQELQTQIEIVQNAAQQAMRMALAQTVETDKRLN